MLIIYHLHIQEKSKTVDLKPLVQRKSAYQQATFIVN